MPPQGFAVPRQWTWESTLASSAHFAKPRISLATRFAHGLCNLNSGQHRGNTTHRNRPKRPEGKSRAKQHGSSTTEPRRNCAKRLLMPRWKVRILHGPSPKRLQRKGRVRVRLGHSPVARNTTETPAKGGRVLFRSLVGQTILTQTISAGTRACRSLRSAGVAATFAAPAFSAFLEGDCGDEERRSGISPPPSDKRVEKQPDKQPYGQVGAEHVLCALLDGGR
jgi:hypothetical protein